MIGRSWLRGALLFGLGALLGCGGSCGTDAGPVPGGFPPDRLVPRAAQVRLTSSGLDVLASTLSAEATRGLRLSCGVAADCPAGFVDAAGGPVTPTCTAGACSEGAAVAPYVQVALPTGNQGGLELCPSGASGCLAAARFAGFSLRPRAGAGLAADLDLQLSADVAVRAGAADCLVRLRPPSSPTPVAVDVDLGVHSASGATTIGVGAVALNLPPGAVTVVADPVTGDASDPGLCGQLDPGPQIVAELEARLAPLVQGLLTGAFGWTCQGGAGCPSQASCDQASGLCVEAGTGRTLGAPLGYETRLQLPALLGELGYRGTSGEVDTAVAVGGSVDADTDGLALGILGGLEAPSPNPTCATVTDSPVSRPGFTPPPVLPTTTEADLDWDGTPETSYDIAFGASQDLLQQVAWGIYTSGLFCGVITQKDFDGLTTGTLELIIPSVRILAKSHLFPRNEAPARLSVYMRGEPQVVIRSGQVTVRDGEGTWTEPLARLDLDDVEINLSVLVDERYVRVMTVTMDLHIGIGALVTPNNAIEPVLGVGVANLVTGVQVTNSELLAEPPSSLEAAIPTLLSLIVLELSGSQGEIALPEIPGLDVTVLGIRGESGQNIAVYANAQPASGQGNLHGAADTRLSLAELEVPPTEAFSVAHAGGPVLPKVHLDLSGEAPEGGTLEYQVRVDGGPWSTFSTKPARVIEHPALLLQGHHTVEARARVVGDYKTLDATPASLEVLIDSVAPTLDVELSGATAEVDTWDRIGPVTLEVVSDGVARIVDPGQVALPELEGQGGLSIVATDAAGNRTEHVLREAPEAAAPAAPEASGGCMSTGDAAGALAVLLGLIVLLRRRR